MKKPVSSFVCLNIVQFLTALNDNIYKLLLIFLLITLKGPQASNNILALAGATFVIPFLLFASLAGSLADRYSKRQIITITRVTEIFVLSLGVIAFWLQSPFLGYGVLFLMATQSALFSPCKFGILPEIVEGSKISHYNGVMTATTYLAIIVGTFLASFLADITHKNFVFSSLVCLVISLLGATISFGIEKTKACASNKKIQLLPTVFKTLKKTKRTRYLFIVIIFAAYFLFMGSFIQLNIIPYTLQSLHHSEIQGGYLFLMTAIGIGIGSFLSGRISGKEIELGFAPLAAFGMGLIFSCLYFFDAYFYAVVCLLVALGILGGFYIVPIDAFIQVGSVAQDRGQNIAASNFLSFLAVLISASLIWFLGSFLKLSAAFGFLTISLITFLVAIVLFLLMSDQVLRLFMAKMAKPFWDISISGREGINYNKPAVIIAKRERWLDTVIVMAVLPRLIRYIVPIKGSFRKQRSKLYRLLSLIPIDIEHYVPERKEAVLQMRNELSLGHSVCLMIPEDVEKWQETILQFANGIPLVVIEISRKTPPKSYLKQFFYLFKTQITVKFN